MVEGMDKIRAGLGIPCVASDSSVFLEMMCRVMVVTNRQVLVTLTTPVAIVGKKGILRATVSDRTCEAEVELIAATVVETVRAAHKAIIPLISHGVSSRLVGVAVRVATTLTLAIIHLFICRVERARMIWWRTGAGFVGKTRIC